MNVLLSCFCAAFVFLVCIRHMSSWQPQPIKATARDLDQACMILQAVEDRSNLQHMLLLLKTNDSRHAAVLSQEPS